MVVAAYLALAVVTVLMVPNEVTKAFLAGVWSAAILGVVAWAWRHVTPGTSWHDGADAEEYTAQELRSPARRAGAALRYGIPFVDGDMDLVLVAPQRVVLVETKSARSPVSLSKPPPWLLKAAVVTSGRRTRLRSWLRHDGAPPVDAVVALWGPRPQGDEVEEVELHGVRIVRGGRLNGLARELTSGPTVVDVERVRTKIDEYVRRFSEHEANRGSPRRGSRRQRAATPAR